jgi:hypothetical protein
MIKMKKADNRKEQTKWMGNEHERKEGVKSTKEMKERRRKIMREMAERRIKRMVKEHGKIDEWK